MTSISVDTRRKHSSSDVFAVFGFLALLILFYPELFIAKAASLKGDHWEQHYPWAFYMAQSLKQGIWPFWTSLIQCGFPIAAESQMGLFYLPNLLLYSFLPFQWAYAYMNLFHFFIAGLGTYLYCRKMGLTPLGAFVAGSIFVFGTGYGGAYYNITSLKTIAWFPWILWSFEVFEASLKKRYVFLTAFFISLSVLAGYLQVAVLALGIGSVYFLLRLFFFTEAGKSMPFRFGVAAWMAIAIVIAVLVSLPQLFLTAELATFSNRADLSEGYAYVGSLAPMALLTLVFPKLQGIFRGSCIYSGIFSIYFIAAAFFAVDKNRRRMLWLWLTVGIISLLLALGQWSPLYLGLIKLTRFYAFRIPAKFVIFLCFSLAVLGGAGIEDRKSVV